MMRRIFVIVSLMFIPLSLIPAFSQEITKVEFSDMIAREKIREYKHVLVLGINQPFSKGYDKYSPLFFYGWFGDNFKNKDLYMQFTMTTTRIYFIAAMKTDKIFAGVKPLLEHSTYCAWKSYNRGYNDKFREFGGNNAGAGVFFQYNWLRILSTKATFHASYHFYRLFLLAENEHKYVNMPRRHWQVKPGLEILLSDVREKSLARVKHGYLFRVEYFSHVASVTAPGMIMTGSGSGKSSETYGRLRQGRPRGCGISPRCTIRTAFILTSAVITISIKT